MIPDKSPSTLSLFRSVRVWLSPVGGWDIAVMTKHDFSPFIF